MTEGLRPGGLGLGLTSGGLCPGGGICPGGWLMSGGGLCLGLLLQGALVWGLCDGGLWPGSLHPGAFAQWGFDAYVGGRLCAGVCGLRGFGLWLILVGLYPRGCCVRGPWFGNLC